MYWNQQSKKYKARLNAHEGQQVHGVNYWETFAPIIKWTTIRLIMTLIMMHGWKSRLLDFVLAYPQGDVGKFQHVNVKGL